MWPTRFFPSSLTLVLGLKLRWAIPRTDNGREYCGHPLPSPMRCSWRLTTFFRNDLLCKSRAFGLLRPTPSASQGPREGHSRQYLVNLRRVHGHKNLQVPSSPPPPLRGEGMVEWDFRTNAEENLPGQLARREAADRLLTRGHLDQLTRYSRTGVMGIHLPLPAGGALWRYSPIPLRSDR